MSTSSAMRWAPRAPVGVLLVSASFCVAAAPVGEVGWPTYNNGYDGQRHSPLSEINTSNVATMKRTCVAKLGDDGAFQPGMVMVNNTLVVTTTHTTVALNPSNCEVRWRHVYKPEQNFIIPVNRGAAVHGSRVFRGTADGRILALDFATGKELWRVKAADPTVGEYYSAAPIAWNGKLYLGIAGSDLGIRGRMAAFDVATGKEIWRWYSIPVGTEPGAETWIPPASARRGGGGFWTTFTLDTASGELFIPVANPAPDFNTDPGVREGKNLYTNSMVVLDARTGKMKWFHQFTPNDPWDWDFGAAPALFTGPDKKPRIAGGSKDGHLYGFDRAARKLEFKTAVTTVHDSTGKRPTPEGIHMCPGATGGVQWNGPAYDAKNGAIVVGAVDLCMIYTVLKPNYIAGEAYLAGLPMPGPNDRPYGWITSVDAVSGKVRWKYEAKSLVIAAVTPTAGGVVFAGDALGTFLALNSADGKVLFQQTLNGTLGGGIITYAVNNKQYVAVAAGNASRLPVVIPGGGSTEVVIYTLGLAADEPKVITAGPARMEWTIAKSKDGKPDAAAGKHIYSQFCGVCHGGAGEGGAGPSLKDAKVRLGFATIVDRIKSPLPKMPKLPLDDQEIQNISAYVESFK